MKVKNKKTGKIEDLRLPKDFKAKWIKALRSDEFKQGNMQLHNEVYNTYCCLGVACRIQHPKMNLRRASLITNASFRLRNLKVPKVLTGDLNPIVRSLISMNDRGRSFKYIAKWIERYL